MKARYWLSVQHKQPNCHVEILNLCLIIWAAGKPLQQYGDVHVQLERKKYYKYIISSQLFINLFTMSHIIYAI